MSKFSKKFFSRSPLKSGIGDIHAQQRRQANLEPLLGTKKNIDGKTDYDMGEEFDAKVDEERKHVEGTEYQPGFESHQIMRKDQLKKKSPLKDPGHRAPIEPHSHPDSYYEAKGETPPGKEKPAKMTLEEAKRLAQQGRESGRYDYILEMTNRAIVDSGGKPAETLEEALMLQYELSNVLKE